MSSNWGTSQVIHPPPFLRPSNFDLTSQSGQSHRRSHITWRLVSWTSAVSASREMRRTYTKSPWDWDHFALFQCLLSMRGCNVILKIDHLFCLIKLFPTKPPFNYEASPPSSMWNKGWSMVADLAKAHNLHPGKGRGVWKRYEMQQRGLVNKWLKLWSYKTSTLFSLSCAPPAHLFRSGKSIYTKHYNSSIFKKKWPL